MKNNIYILILLIFFSTYSSWIYAGEQFNFDVTEIEIFEKGNKFKGTKRGTITTDNGIVLDADTFEYDKTKNVLNAKGNVILKDLNNDELCKIATFPSGSEMKWKVGSYKKYVIAAKNRGLKCDVKSLIDGEIIDIPVSKVKLMLAHFELYNEI